MEQKVTKYGKAENLKSLTIGLLLGICLMLITGISRVHSDLQGTGKYRGCAGADGAVFVIDTQTGQTWKMDGTMALDFGTPHHPADRRNSVASFYE